MQGIISGAMCLQLNTLGLRHCFDAVYGASAGAVNGAYFIANQNQVSSSYLLLLPPSLPLPLPPLLLRPLPLPLPPLPQTHILEPSLQSGPAVLH